MPNETEDSDVEAQNAAQAEDRVRVSAFQAELAARNQAYHAAKPMRFVEMRLDLAEKQTEQIAAHADPESEAAFQARNLSQSSQ